MMPRRLLWALCLLPSLAWGQRQFALADYLASRPGDTLQLRYALPERLAGQPMVLTFDTLPGGQLERRLDGQPSQAYFLDSLGGWRLAALGGAAGRWLLLDEPLRLAPAVVAHGQVYTAQGAYVLFEGGRRLGQGQIAARVEVLGHHTSTTHLHNFGDCLLLSTAVEWRLPDGAFAGFEAREWYARDTGLVKAAGQEFRKNTAGAILAAERLAAVLERAFVGGAWME